MRHVMMKTTPRLKKTNSRAPIEIWHSNPETNKIEKVMERQLEGDIQATTGLFDGSAFINSLVTNQGEPASVICFYKPRT